MEFTDFSSKDQSYNGKWTETIALTDMHSLLLIMWSRFSVELMARIRRLNESIFQSAPTLLTTTNV